MISFLPLFFLVMAQLRSRLPMLDTEEYDDPKKVKPWYGKLRTRPFTPNPTVWCSRQQVRLPNGMTPKGKAQREGKRRTMDRCAPLGDEWWKCIIERDKGDEARIDSAQSLVSRVWGLHFEGGNVTHDGAALRAYWETQEWLAQHRTYQAQRWEEYRAHVAVMWQGHHAVCGLGDIAKRGHSVMERTWNGESVWAVAWRAVGKRRKLRLGRCGRLGTVR